MFLLIFISVKFILWNDFSLYSVAAWLHYLHCGGNYRWISTPEKSGSILNTFRATGLYKYICVLGHPCFVFNFSLSIEYYKYMWFKTTLFFSNFENKGVYKYFSATHIYPTSQLGNIRCDIYMGHIAQNVLNIEVLLLRAY